MLGLLKIVLFLTTHHLDLSFVLIHLSYKTPKVVLPHLKGYTKMIMRFLKILNEFLNTSDEASVSPNLHRNRLDTFIHQKNNVTTTDNRLSGHFCSETIFNVSNRVLTNTEIKVLEKGLDFAPIQKKLNQSEVRSHFNGF